MMKIHDPLGFDVLAGASKRLGQLGYGTTPAASLFEL